MGAPAFKEPEAPAAARAGVRDLHACDPEPFERDLNKCRDFLLQCRLVFDQCPLSFAIDSARVNFLIGLLRGKVLTWAEALSARFGNSYLR